MEDLPPEITSEVLRNMSKRDFKVMRMVSRKFYAISSQLLFSKVYASLQWKDLIILIKISRHPALRPAVHELVYSGVFFPTSQPKGTDGSSESSVDQYYCDRIEEQNAVLEGGINAATISAALARMPNVRRVILTNHWRPTRDLFGQCTFATRFLGRVDIPDDARFGGPLHREYPLCLKKPSGCPLRMGIDRHA
ncbi:hypothetical protein BKA56DRAFT_603748 [Ilyonectria sp. MPI-CAGE-AT-0026]|nr:hypothetical protein BKA56DRAFT_603748 [Ilyonectria sp. MPI-CAGE-AT-0026]